jgi:hypothetical protein
MTFEAISTDYSDSLPRSRKILKLVPPIGSPASDSDDFIPERHSNFNSIVDENLKTKLATDIGFRLWALYGIDLSAQVFQSDSDKQPDIRYDCRPVDTELQSNLA